MEVVRRDKYSVLLDLGDGVFLSVFSQGRDVQLQFAGASGKLELNSPLAGAKGRLTAPADRVGTQVYVNYKSALKGKEK